jgi:signal transduction histidine kinase
MRNKQLYSKYTSRNYSKLQSAYLESILYNLISNAIRYSDPLKKLIININLIEEGTTKFLEIIMA